MITKNTKFWQYFSHLFVSIDQLGNVVAGGNSDNTISARVGYYTNHYYPYTESEVPWYWSLLERIINTTFYPVDGPNHCHEAYHNDPGEIFDNRVTNFFVVIIAAGLIMPSCIIIALILYFLSALRIVKKKTINREKNLERRIDSCNLLLRSTKQEIFEHNIDSDLNEAKKKLENLIMQANQIKIMIDNHKV
tara:strand:+ start:726644 stop:727219 length:576 start_codon:yes stop_codon:yes gene_type:complete